MEKTELLKKLSKLELQHEKHLGELVALDSLMRSIGFDNGLETVKQTAKELGEQNNGIDEE